jgi:hypothetical protein
VKVKNLFKDDFAFFGRGFLKVDPEEQIRVRQKRRHQEHRNVLGMQTTLRRKSERPNHVETY